MLQFISIENACELFLRKAIFDEIRKKHKDEAEDIEELKKQFKTLNKSVLKRRWLRDLKENKISEAYSLAIIEGNAGLNKCTNEIERLLRTVNVPDFERMKVLASTNEKKEEGEEPPPYSLTFYHFLFNALLMKTLNLVGGFLPDVGTPGKRLRLVFLHPFKVIVFSGGSLGETVETERHIRASKAAFLCPFQRSLWDWMRQNISETEFKFVVFKRKPPPDTPARQGSHTSGMEEEIAVAAMQSEEMGEETDPPSPKRQRLND